MLFLLREVVVNAEHVASFVDQSCAEVRAEKSGISGHQQAFAPNPLSAYLNYDSAMGVWSSISKYIQLLTSCLCPHLVRYL